MIKIQRPSERTKYLTLHIDRNLQIMTFSSINHKSACKALVIMIPVFLGPSQTFRQHFFDCASIANIAATI
ncbi:hypothetical protein AD942_10160 [Gluconobacter japonicus]|nr:hypothetical protein AD938_11305 [Gluconobacter japonicus]KXV39669.1 hypothetical protein AD942_10160 [Gluconobacter japonicus]